MRATPCRFRSLPATGRLYLSVRHSTHLRSSAETKNWIRPARPVVRIHPAVVSARQATGSTDVPAFAGGNDGDRWRFAPRLRTRGTFAFPQTSFPAYLPRRSRLPDPRHTNFAYAGRKVRRRSDSQSSVLPGRRRSLHRARGRG